MIDKLGSSLQSMEVYIPDLIDKLGSSLQSMEVYIPDLIDKLGSSLQSMEVYIHAQMLTNYIYQGPRVVGA